MDYDDALEQALKSAGFDPAAGIDLVGGDPDFFAELVGDLYEEFLSDPSDFMPLTAPAAGDTSDAIRKVHSLKSSLRTLSGGALADLAEQVERDLRTGDFSVEKVQRLNMEVAQLRGQLLPFVKS